MKNIQILYIYIFIGDWGLGIGDWGLGIGPNPQSPIPNPHIFYDMNKYIYIYIHSISIFFISNKKINLINLSDGRKNAEKG